MSQSQFLGRSNKGNERPDYTRKGKRNKTAFPEQFVKICRYEQKELKSYLVKKLAKYYCEGDVIVSDGFIYVRGQMPVCVTAHMDTVHKEKCREIYGYHDKKNNRNIISSPQGIGGDDRCGIYMIMNIIQTTNYRPYILFCEDEEIGSVGCRKFTMTEYVDELKDVLFAIELDRANANDLVYYDDINTDFHNWCMEVTGYVENRGSWSDISELCPEIGASGVNISCGYYNAHHTDEYVVLEEMMSSIKATKKLLKASKELTEKFEYKEDRYLYGYGFSRSLFQYRSGKDYYTNYFGDDDEGYGLLCDDSTDKADESKQKKNVCKHYYNEDEMDYYVGVMYTHSNGQQNDYYGWSEEECLGQFLMEHPHISYSEIEEIQIVA